MFIHKALNCCTFFAYSFGGFYFFLNSEKAISSCPSHFRRWHLGIESALVGISAPIVPIIQFGKGKTWMHAQSRCNAVTFKFCWCHAPVAYQRNHDLRSSNYLRKLPLGKSAACNDAFKRQVSLWSFILKIKFHFGNLLVLLVWEI